METNLEDGRVLCELEVQDGPADLDAFEGDFWAGELAFSFGGFVCGGGEDEKRKEGRQWRRQRGGDLEGDDAMARSEASKYRKLGREGPGQSGSRRAEGNVPWTYSSPPSSSQNSTLPSISQAALSQASGPA